MKELKPCPFCGGEVYIVKGVTGLHMIFCEDCGLTASFQNKEGKKEAIKAWNRRVKE